MENENPENGNPTSKNTKNQRLKVFLSVEIGGLGKQKTKIVKSLIPSIKIPKISDLCSSEGFWRVQNNHFYFFARPLKSCRGAELSSFRQIRRLQRFCLFFT